MPSVYLGLGSNIEAPENIRSAMVELKNAFENTAFSSVFQSPAVGFEGDDFLNLVARVDTGMAPLNLTSWLHELEDRHGRDRTAPRWSSRTLDVDILLYGDLWLLSPELEIPRGEILEAAHVLKPLAELSPGLLHPIAQISMSELWKAFPIQGLELESVRL